MVVVPVSVVLLKVIVSPMTVTLVKFSVLPGVMVTLVLMVTGPPVPMVKGPLNVVLVTLKIVLVTLKVVLFAMIVPLSVGFTNVCPVPPPPPVPLGKQRVMKGQGLHGGGLQISFFGGGHFGGGGEHGGVGGGVHDGDEDDDDEDDEDDNDRRIPIEVIQDGQETVTRRRTVRFWTRRARTRGGHTKLLASTD